MTDRFYDAGGSGSNTSPYETAAKASTTFAAALAAVAATDEIIYVLSTSNQTITTSTFTASATYATAKSPQRLYSVSSLSDPTTPTFGAKIRPNADGDDHSWAGYWDLYGIHLDYSAGSGICQINFYVATTKAYHNWDSCKVSFSSNTSINNSLFLGGTITSSGYILNFKFKNLTLVTKGTGTPFNIGQTNLITIDNLILSGSAAPTTVFAFQDHSRSKLILKNSDLTGVAWTNLFNVAGANVIFDISIIDCKLPASYTLFTGTIGLESSVITLINTGNTDVNYEYAKYTLAGSVITTASIYATTSPIVVGGVSVSDIFTSTASCGRQFTLTREYFVEVADDTTVTPFVEILVQTSAAAKLKTNDVYITAETVTVAGTTQGSKITSYPGIVAVGEDCQDGTTAYTGDGYANETTHRITTASLTTRQAGLVKITVYLAKASTAIYVGRVGVA